jgi:hypothetical protein
VRQERLVLVEEVWKDSRASNKDDAVHGTGTGFCILLHSRSRMQKFCIFSQAPANARSTLQTTPEFRKLFPNKGVRHLFGRGDVPFPKLDVVGSNPIARF